MMKKILFAALSLPLVTLPVLSAKEHTALKITGEICHAVNDNNADNRLESLLQTLAAHPDSFEAMKAQLTEDLNAQPLSAGNLKLLQKVLAQTPANFDLASLVASCMRRSGADDREILDTLERTARKLNFAAMDKNTLPQALKWCQAYLRLAADERALDRANATLELWLKNSGSHRVALLPVAGHFYTLATVLDSDFIAADPRWKDMPENRWKKRCEQVIAELKKVESCLSMQEAVPVMEFYADADLPEASRFYKQLLKRFPLDFSPEQVVLMAIVLKDSSIYDLLPAKSKYPTFEFFVALSNKEYKRARTLLSGPLKGDWEYELAYACATNNKNNINFVLRNCSTRKEFNYFTLIFILEAAHARNSITLLNYAWKKGEHQHKNAHFANSYAYVAACLNTDMTRAGQLLEFAIKIYPDNPAVLDSLAHYHFKRKDFKRAGKFIQRAIRKLDDTHSPATILLHAADIELANSNDRGKAAGYLHRALKCRQPDDREFDLKRAKELEAVLL